MKNVLQIVDTYHWAIGELAKAVVRNNPQFNWELYEVHPKGLERGEIDLKPVKEAIQRADIIDVQYWRTLSQLAEMIPEIKEKKIMLTHHNEKNLLSEDWSYVDLHIAKTKYSEKELSKEYGKDKVKLIYNSFDPDKFEYNDNYPPLENIVGYVGRVVPWKGLKDVAKACYELGYPLMVMGKMDKPSYYNEIPEEHRNNILWDFFNCDEESKLEFYKHIKCYVGNSNRGREVGTLGFVEALASGVPVVTTRAGMANDIVTDQKDAYLVDFEDYDDLKEGIRKVMEDEKFAKDLRKNGWELIKNYNHERMALDYRDAINSLIYNHVLVSVVIPATYEREEQVKEILNSLANNTYGDIEVIIVWDEKEKKNVELPIVDFPVLEFVTLSEGYNLACARNTGVINARGHWIMFNDARLLPNEDAIEKLLDYSGIMKWVFGEKGGNKDSFVENFSLIARDEFINAGMCCERITEYGGMSQELRTRFERQGFDFKYAPEARAEVMSKSRKSPERRRSIIRMKNRLYQMYG